MIRKNRFFSLMLSALLVASLVVTSLSPVFAEGETSGENSEAVAAKTGATETDTTEGTEVSAGDTDTTGEGTGTSTEETGTTTGEASDTTEEYKSNIKISSTSQIMVKGQKVQVSLYDRNDSSITAITDGVKWKSTKKSVAAVTKKGVIKAKKKGKATIYTTYKGKKYKCKIKVYNSLSASKRQKLAIKEAKSIVKRFTDSSMSRKEKATRLALYMCVNVASQDNQSTAAYKKNFGNEAYAALIMHHAACSGRARGYMLLCKYAGIPCKHVNANKWTHQWNKVKIGKKWYEVDTQIGSFEYKVTITQKMVNECIEYRHLGYVY